MIERPLTWDEIFEKLTEKQDLSDLQIKYANGNSKEFYQIGTSTNTTGISIYLFSNKDKDYFPKKFKDKLGKATITGYCIKFKTLKDLNIEILKEIIKEVFIL